jgi:branched-chain amino acid transport system permease protein
MAAENIVMEDVALSASKPTHTASVWFYLCILALLVIFPLLTRDDYFLHTAIMIFLFLIYTTTYRLILVTGQLHLGANAFIGAGAYASAIMVRDLGVSFWFAIFLAGAVAAALAVGIGYFALRVKGVYFAIITWSFAESLRFLYMRVESVFGGPSGLFGIPGPDPLPLFGQINFFEKTHYYYLALVLFLFTLWILYRLENSRFGLVLAGIREGDRLAASVGVNIMRYKVATFAICSGLAGMGGSFYAHYTYFISPNDFTVLLTIFIALYAVVGGLSKLSGAIIGTVVLLIAGELFTGFGFYRMMLFAGLTILVLLFFPGGLVDFPKEIRSAWMKYIKQT